VWQQPDEFGLQALKNHPHYTALLPNDLCAGVQFMIQTYRGDRQRQQRLWRPVKAQLKDWKKTYRQLRCQPPYGPILSYRDGREFLIIRQKRIDAPPFTHRLRGKSREIYLFCRTHRSLERIVARFAPLTEGQVLPFLRMMVDKRLMFAENGRYLSLAASRCSDAAAQEG